jgi:hypothetical protein
MQTITNTDYQQELLKIIPPNITKEDVKEIRKFMVKYFASKATAEMDKFWDEKGFASAADMEKYLNE